MSDRPKRKAIPLGVRLEACLLLLGLDPADVEWHHSIPLGLRPVNDAGDDYDPPQLDPKYIVPMESAAHAVQTDGVPHQPLSGDKSRIAKAKRLERKRPPVGLKEGDTVTVSGFERFGFRDGSALVVTSARPKPKRKIPSRPFQKRKKEKR